MKEMATHSWTRLQNGTGSIYTVHWVRVTQWSTHTLTGPIFPLQLLQRIENQGSENTRTSWLLDAGQGCQKCAGAGLTLLGGAKAKHAT